MRQQVISIPLFRNQYLQPPRWKFRKLVLAMSLTLGAGTGFSQSLEEIIVTAQKRTESIQDTPISIAAMTSADLEKKGINEIGDLRTQVPSLQVLPHPTSAVTARVYMRGVGNADDQLTQDPSVAVYFDGVYVARSQGLASEVADIERIEVLRGPQGSLYGRNATGGAINFISREPELGIFNFKQSLTFGNYDLFRSRTRLNVPIGEELAAEFSYLNMKRDGFIKNLGSGVDNFHDKDREAFRVAFLWQPIDNLNVRYSFDRSEVNDAPALATRVPLYPQELDRPSRGGSLRAQRIRPNDAVAQGHNVTATWDVTSDLTLKSITGYRDLDNSSFQNSFIGSFGPGDGVIARNELDQKQFSQEFQAIGEALDGRLEYLVGAYYFDESADGATFTRFPANIAPGSDTFVTIDNSAYALFGQATYRSANLEGLYFTPSLRWSRDERKATLQITRYRGWLRYQRRCHDLCTLGAGLQDGWLQRSGQHNRKL